MEHINKHRSPSSCIREGYALFRGNMKNIFVTSRKELLAASLLISALVYVLVYYPSAPLIAVFAALSFEGFVFFKARIFDMINYRPYKWNVLRMNIVMLLALAVCCLLVGTGFLLQVLETNGALLGAALLGILLVAIPMVAVTLQLMLAEKHRALHAYIEGCKHYGALVLTIGLSTLICCCILAVICTPMAIAIYAAISNQSGIAAGDPNGLPTYFPYLLFLISFLTIYATLYVQTWQTYAMAFLHGSITYKPEKQ